MKKMKSKTTIKKQMKRKTNPSLVETLREAGKQKGWANVAGILSGATRKFSAINLDEINEQTKEGDTIIVPGRVLGAGELHKKIKICALGFSTSAREKLKDMKIEATTIAEEIKHNPKASGIKVLQ